MYDVLTGSGVASGRDVPPFLPLGSDAVSEITNSAAGTISQIKEWREIAAMTDFPKGN